MTDQSNIPSRLTGDKDGKNAENTSPKAKDSLLERASGAFGLNPFKVAPIKRNFPEREIKHARIRKKTQQTVVDSAPAGQADGKAVSDVSTQLVETAGLPVPAARSEIIVPESFPAVELNDKNHVIDRELLLNQALIVPEAPAGAVIEEFRIVKRNILSYAREKGTARSRRVLICSPHPEDGKTFCASNLALAMSSERDMEVILIDADFSKPSILSIFGLPKGPGLLDCLSDKSVNPEDLVMKTDIGGLYVLSAGNPTSSDTEFLASKRTAAVLDRLTANAPNRIVIFDTPPVLAASSAAELAKHIGQTILVARADHTGQNALEDAYHLLSESDDIKLLLNAVQFSPSGRIFGSYYGYGE